MSVLLRIPATVLYPCFDAKPVQIQRTIFSCLVPEAQLRKNNCRVAAGRGRGREAAPNRASIYIYIYIYRERERNILRSASYATFLADPKISYKFFIPYEKVIFLERFIDREGGFSIQNFNLGAIESVFRVGNSIIAL